MEDNSEEFSEDDSDVFEESVNETKQKPIKNHTTYNNKPYDEVYEVSQDLSVAESFDGRGDKNEKEKLLRNDKYDVAVEVSQSMEQSAMAPSKSKPLPSFGSERDTKGPNSSSMDKNSDLNRSQSVQNNKFDEVLDLSQSGSEGSVDTQGSQKHNKSHKNNDAKSSNNQQSQQKGFSSAQMQSNSGKPQVNTNQPTANPLPSKGASPKKKTIKGEEESSEEDEGEHEESYDNIEGAYNPKDYSQLNVATEVRDLFQYIERYKPQEVELQTSLKCFIPEYIPAIGELDAFIKIPRPDGKEDDLGLKILDEPSNNQSDSTVLELQLRAKSKKQQYGDVVVRSIESAEKNGHKIDKWIQDIRDLHRSKPPPQVVYKRSMPEMDKLMDVWPEKFESMLQKVPLPSPDLDLSIAEYAKVLCGLVDIPTYDNPIESLHLLFSLFIEFRNNPHFQARLMDGGYNDNGQLNPNGGGGRMGRGDPNYYGAADVLAIEQDYK